VVHEINLEVGLVANDDDGLLQVVEDGFQLPVELGTVHDL